MKILCDQDLEGVISINSDGDRSNQISLREYQGRLQVKSCDSNDWLDVLNVETSHFVGEIKSVSFSKVPAGWKVCNGELLDIIAFPSLFSVIGNTYGGDGITTFALPDMRDKFPIGTGDAYNLGAKGGNKTSDIPAHNHNVEIAIPVNTEIYEVTTATNTPSNTCTLGQGKAGSFPVNIYTKKEPTPEASLKPFTAQTNTVGTGTSISTIPPYLSLNYIIAVTGKLP